MEIKRSLVNNNEFLIKSLKSGDREAFNEVYKLFYAPLHGYLSQYVPVADSEDIIQNTMLWLWDNTHSLIESMSLKSLLFTIAKNKALNKISHNEVKARIHQDIYDKYKEQFDDPDFYIGTELMQKLEDAIKRLPEDYRNAFVMNRFDGLTYNEIAERLDVSPKTISYRITQALKILRNELKDYLPLLLWLLIDSN